MMSKTHKETRTLLILSKDYGELGFAMSLLRGQELARHARIVLPHRLFSINKDALPFSAAPYATLDDIISSLEAHKPDVVFLLSGYLFSGDGLLSADSVETLLRWLRDSGCRVITSDPWLGMAPRLTFAEVDVRMHPEAHRLLYRLLLPIQRLLNPGRKVARISSLEQVTNLYPTSIPICDDDTPRVSVFNPTIIRAATGSSLAAGPGDGATHETRLRWLFVISATELYVQSVMLGRSRLTRYVLGLLRNAAEAGAHPTLIAPSSMVDRLARAVPASVELLSFCPFAEFEQRLLDAEYVFYWNVFSFSQYARLANELPFFVFDRGHASRIVPSYYEIARSCHYGGWEPPYLDQRKLPSPDDLAQLAKAQKPWMAALRERWQASPTPDELVNQLLG